MFTFLLVVHAILAAALVAVILMQRSEGGGLGMGGSPSGLMSARGAADFLTRATTVLAALFVAMCIALATLASVSRTGGELDTSLARTPAAPTAPNPLGGAPNAQLPVTPAPTSDPLAAPAPATTPRPAARVERVAPRPTRDPVAQPAPAAPAPAPRAAGQPTSLPGVINAPSIPAGNNSSTPNN